MSIDSNGLLNKFYSSKFFWLLVSFAVDATPWFKTFSPILFWSNWSKLALFSMWDGYLSFSEMSWLARSIISCVFMASNCSYDAFFGSCWCNEPLLFWFLFNSGRPLILYLMVSRYSLSGCSMVPNGSLPFSMSLFLPTTCSGSGTKNFSYDYFLRYLLDAPLLPDVPFSNVISGLSLDLACGPGVCC